MCQDLHSMLDGVTVTKERQMLRKMKKWKEKKKGTAKQHNISLMQFFFSFNFQLFGGSVNTSYILCFFF